MAGTRKPRGPVRIIITEDSEGYWITKGKYGVRRFSHASAMTLARTMFLEAGGEGKAVIIDRTRHKASPGVTYLPDGTIFIKPTGGSDGAH